RFVEAGDEMVAAGTGRAGADPEPTGEFRLPGGRERRAFFMAHADPFDLAAPDRVAERVQGVADQAEDVSDADLLERFDQGVGYGPGHRCSSHLPQLIVCHRGGQTTPILDGLTYWTTVQLVRSPPAVGQWRPDIAVRTKAPRRRYRSAQADIARRASPGHRLAFRRSKEAPMSRYALYVPLEAKPGKEREVAEFLRSALPLVNAEPGTRSWFAIQEGPSSFAIFDTFDDEASRDAHLNGKVAAA